MKKKHFLLFLLRIISIQAYAQKVEQATLQARYDSVVNQLNLKIEAEKKLQIRYDSVVRELAYEIRYPKNWAKMQDRYDSIFKLPTTTTGDPNQIYTVTTLPAEYKFGNERMVKFLRKNFKYPKNAQRMGIEGKVFARFVVNQNGGIDKESIEVLKGMPNCEECNQEVLRLIKAMPDFIPAVHDGFRVRCYVRFPFAFKLTD